MRQFASGATRNTDEDKLDYDGFFSPRVLKRRAEYMHQHRVQADGKIRASDNWKKGIPLDAYMKSGWRHFWEWWSRHHGSFIAPEGDIEEAICALMFNCEGYLEELLKAKDQEKPKPAYWPNPKLATPVCKAPTYEGQSLCGACKPRGACWHTSGG